MAIVLIAKIVVGLVTAVVLAVLRHSISSSSEVDVIIILKYQTTIAAQVAFSVGVLTLM